MSLVLMLAGCGEASRAAPSADPAASASASASTEATAAPAASSSSAASTAPEIPVPSAAKPKSEPPRTGRPGLARLCRAAERHVLEQATPDSGEAFDSCAYVMADEWVVLGCTHHPERGTLSGLNPGGGSQATADELTAALGDMGFAPTIGAIISLRPGTTAKPLFMFRPVEHPEWMRDISFTFSFPEGADFPDGLKLPYAVKTLPRDTSHCAQYDAPPPPKEVEPLQVPDVADLEAAPDDAAWAAQKDGFFPGSDAAGCKTKSIGPWFRAECSGKLVFSKAEVERGQYATQTSFGVQDGKFTLLTPYVEGTHLRIKLSSDGGERFLRLRWKPGKRPYEIGKLSETRE